MKSDLKVRWQIELNEDEAHELLEAIRCSNYSDRVTDKIENDLSNFLDNQGFYEE
ncbi:MAG: hypothetical protein Unbinned5081contig1003_36 [Prokaryotic dsDNA virus sp.]|nr:MAG: hypothetical protein Unbinned5081contig1003_36 [Prokaryotic dsDNA virus sp.]|tara:strand:- start:32824 stop:32988 length:165 start_codon:yes stop_codon:yes gene_type:complete